MQIFSACSAAADGVTVLVGIRNLGVLAHVDAGKTTLTERLLHLAGCIRTLGDVDKGTSLSDGMDVEKRRGISVRASTLTFEWQGVRFNLIDTPGHADFSAEVERSLRVLDAVVLVVSAVEGIQAQTAAIWEAAAAMGLPVLLFLNKIDRVGADADAVVEQIAREFSPDILPLNRSRDQGLPAAGVDPLFALDGKQLLERIAEKDDPLLESYLEGEQVEPEALRTSLVASVRQRRLFPVLCGCSKNGAGVEALLQALVDFLPDAEADGEAPLSGVVFRVDHEPRLGRVAGVRLYRGRVRNRDVLRNHTAGRDEKVTQVKKRYLDRYEDTGALDAGDIGFLCGMPEVRIGDILGDPGPVPGVHALAEPLISVRVEARDATSQSELAGALQQMSSEDPHLGFRWDDDEQELQVRIMGTVQTEILTEVLASRFGIEAAFGDPTVIYKETPAQAGGGGDSYTMPNPCWAIVEYQLNPAPRGSGVTFRSEVSVDAIKRKYQNEIAAAIPEALEQGIKGWEVTDLEIVLVDGSDHVLHSRPGDFKLATNIALMKGLTATGTTLLEPILAFRVAASEEFVGKVAADVVSMRGSFEPATIADGQFVLRGRFPLAASLDYVVRLGSLTGGRGKLSVRFDGYEECSDEIAVGRGYRGISPLDRSKYILQMRGAITQSLSG